MKIQESSADEDNDAKNVVLPKFGMFLVFSVPVLNNLAISPPFFLKTVSGCTKLEYIIIGYTTQKSVQHGTMSSSFVLSQANSGSENKSLIWMSYIIYC